MRILEKALITCALCVLLAPAARADSSADGWQPPAALAGATLVPLDQAEGRTALILRRTDAAPGTPASGAPVAKMADGSEMITVIVDGVVMELPRWVVEGQIRNGVFIVIGRWTIQWGVIMPVLR